LGYSGIVKAVEIGVPVETFNSRTVA
jgi:hypothetical protein